MTIEQYQIEAKRTCAPLASYEQDIMHMNIGIFTECGELLDAIKKNYAYRKHLDLVNIGEEIGDIAWYLVNELTFEGRKGNDVEFKRKSVLLKKYNDIDHVILCIFLIVNQSPKIALLELMSVANYFNLDFYELLDKNIAKLKARYPEKFDTEKALNRDLETERKILEQ